MVEDDIQQLRLPGWSAKWAPLEVKPTSRDIRSWSFLLIEPSGQRQFSPGLLTYVGQVTEPEPGPMDTHLAADDLLENLLKLRAKLN